MHEIVDDEFDTLEKINDMKSKVDFNNAISKDRLTNFEMDMWMNPAVDSSKESEDVEEDIYND